MHSPAPQIEGVLGAFILYTHLATFGTRALDLARALSQLPKRATRMGWYLGMEQWLWAERITSNRRKPSDSDRDAQSCVATYPYPAKNITIIVPCTARDLR